MLFIIHYFREVTAYCMYNFTENLYLYCMCIFANQTYLQVIGQNSARARACLKKIFSMYIREVREPLGNCDKSNSSSKKKASFDFFDFMVDLNKTD